MTVKSSTSDKIRLQVDLAPEQFETIKRMMEEIGVSTRKELFNNAMTLLEWAIEEVGQGNIITSLRPDKTQYVELRMPALSFAAQRKKVERKEVDEAAL